MGAERLYQNLPDIYDRGPESDQHKLLTALSTPIDEAESFVEDFFEDLDLRTADGAGLDRWGQSLGVSRLPGLPDDLYRKLVQVVAGAKRGTLQAIRSVLEAATGLTGWTVADQQTDPNIPTYEIWITPPVGADSSFGRSVYPDLPTHYDGWPVESAIGGDVIGENGFYGGLFNDHPWGPVSLWLRNLLDEIRLAGTRIIWK